MPDRDGIDRSWPAYCTVKLPFAYNLEKHVQGRGRAGGGSNGALDMTIEERAEVKRIIVGCRKEGFRAVKLYFDDESGFGATNVFERNPEGLQFLLDCHGSHATLDDLRQEKLT